MESLRPWRGTLVLLGALCVVLVASLATASAKKPHRHRITFGSNLHGRASAIAHPAYRFDAEFWNASLPDGAVRAPRRGKIVAIKLKTGSDSARIALRISIIRRTSSGAFRVVTTSTPHWILPAHSPGIHTFRTRGLQFPMPLKKGDLVALDTPGVKPQASKWFATAVSGATTDAFASRGPTQNQGFKWTNPTVFPAVELLLQVIEQPG